MFEKTLSDVVKGIRASKRDTALFISQCIAEIKTEINSSDMFVKANALQKLTFLNMLGYNMSWASFASIELMSSTRFAHKRIAYLAASQGFTQDTDVILLTTNLLKKELRGGVYEAGLAINCISNIVTEDLARDLLPELTSLTSHPQPYIRKKAILCLFKVFVKYPQGLRLTFSKIQQCLDDANPSVVSCAVNVITELSDKNPKNYLHLAPAFFQLLTTSSNNWMLIKVVKLLGSLVPEEPRLARKLLEPLADIVRNTKAKSLLYEAVHTITLCLPYCRKSDGSMPAVVPEIVTLCAETLQSFVNEADQNLKYLGLVGFASLMQSHPRVLSAAGYRPIILACLSDQDVTIRSRALSLLGGMASRKNLIELVTQLLKHVELATGSYKLDLVSKIIEMCSSDKYALLTDFVWYLDVLFQLSHLRGLDAHSGLLRSQITDVALRVLPVRAYAVRRSIEILLEGEGTPSSDPYGDNGRGRNIMPEVLPAIAWIIGEYADLIRKSLSVDDEDEDDDEFFLNDKSKGTYHSIIQALMSTSNCQNLPPSTQKIYIQAAMKVFAAATADKNALDPELEASVETIKQNMPLYMQSTDVEVKERAFTAYEFLKSLDLLGGVKYMPTLSTTTIEQSDDDDDYGGAGQAPDGDLLGMVSAMSIQNTSPTKKLPEPLSFPSTGSIPNKCRNAAATLNYVLKPNPMKPTSAKVQRKKSQSPVGIEAGEIESVDLSVFSILFDDEVQSQSSARFSMESVSFTQQTAVRPVEKTLPVSNLSTSLETQICSAGNVGVPSGSALSSFQHANVSEAVNPANVSTRPNQSDPFYLASAPSTNANEVRDPSQFGMIQLSDSDDNYSEDGAKKKKKKRKEKKKRGKKSGGPSSQFFSAKNNNGNFGFGDVTVYESDDEDDTRQNVFPGHSKGGRKKGPAKEFAGLAKVDLTEPLREDEVMPERKNRVVPEHPMNTNAVPMKKSKKKTKKPKKESKKKPKEKGNDGLLAGGPMGGNNGGIGDLLELGGFGNAPPPQPPTSTSIAPSGDVLPSSLAAPSNSNTISDAFEDLLGLQAPAAAPQLAPAAQGPFSSLGLSSVQTSSGAPGKKSGKRPWIRATLKTSNVATSSPVDWTNVALQFRVYRTNQGQGTAAMVLFRVQNTGYSVLRDVILTIKDWNNLVIGEVGPSSFAETDKVGPFVYSQIDSGFDLKGSLSISGAAVGVKISMPVSMQLSPMEGLTLEHVYNELSSPALSAHSVRIDAMHGAPSEAIKPLLCNYLRCAEVEAGGAGGSNVAGTLAAQSLSGAKLFILFKVKENAVKIDLKCSNPKLGKDVASDLKKLLL
jgi:AP-3 complex subunit delta-1